MTQNLIPAISADPALHIASAVVQMHPHSMASVKRWIEAFAGAEIHAQDSCGKLVVVLEADSERRILDLLDGLHQQEGVFNAALVYHEILTGESPIL